MILDITKLGEEILRKKAEPVAEVNDEIRKLADDMIETMIEANGVGLAAPTPEWGLILNDGKAYITSAPYMMFFPALMIMITCFAFNLMGDGLRDAADPYK